MNEFTSSDGVHVDLSEGRVLRVSKGGLVDEVYGEPRVHALREFFRAEEDERLGRWRSNKDPKWTAVHNEHTGTHFSHEDGERRFTIWPDKSNVNAWSYELREVAHEYLDAHPEPKPWHEAEPGEVWVLTVEGGHELAARVSVTNETLSFENVAHITNRFDASDARITAGRRIYPEAGDR